MTKKCASHVFSIPRPQKCGSWASRRGATPKPPVKTLILHAAWLCSELSVRWNEVERRWNAFLRMGRLSPNRRVTR